MKKTTLIAISNTASKIIGWSTVLTTISVAVGTTANLILDMRERKELKAKYEKSIKDKKI